MLARCEWEAEGWGDGLRWEGREEEQEAAKAGKGRVNERG